MQVIVDNMEVRISWKEAVDIYHSLRTAIDYTIQTHWKNHPECFPRDESLRLSMMRSLAGVTGQDFQFHYGELLRSLQEAKKGSEE
jgi:hypothetical protein